MTFCLPRGYKRQKPAPYDDTVERSGAGAWEWQPDVVPFAVDLATLAGLVDVVDVGCGSGEKWEPFGGDFFVRFVDRAEIIEKIVPPAVCALYDFDLESGNPLPCKVEGTLLLCSDVIEHMVDPTNLLATLRQALLDGAECLVISTPDRARCNWTRRKGPPKNPHHAQEWTLDELVEFMTGEGFEIEHAGWTRSNDHEPDEATCLIVATA